MAEIINLRQARKARKRSQDKLEASANRAKFGRTKAECKMQEAEAGRQARELERNRRDPAD